MTTAPPTDSLGGRLRAVLGQVPVDLVLVSLAAALVSTVLLGTESGHSWMRVVVGLPFVLVLPGYALVSAAFPARPTGTVTRPRQAVAYSPGTVERLALSFVFSIALFPLIAVALGLLGIPFETGTIVGSTTVVVVGLSAVGVVRRLALSRTEQYDPPSVLRHGGRFRNWLGAGGTTDTVLSAVLVVAVVLAVGSLAVGLTEPTQGQSFTSVSLVTDGGDAVASNYPTNFSAGESRNLTLQVENHYESAGEYTAVVQLQRVEGRDTGSLTVVDRERLGTLSERVPANETWSRTHAVEPTMNGTDLRLVYFVYRGDVPDSPGVDTADDYVQLWVDVQ